MNYGYRLGIKEIDKAVEVITGDLIMIAGGISSGKSSMAVNICANMTKDSFVYFLSLKMQPHLFCKKIDGIFGFLGDDNRMINSPSLIVDNRLDNIGAYFNRFMDVKDVCGAAIKAKKGHGQLVIIIDSLWNLTYGNDGYDVIKIGKALKSVASELGIVIIATSYIEFDEHPSQVRPSLADLTGGEDVANPFDTIVALWGGDIIGQTRIAKTLIMKGRKCVGNEAVLVFEPSRSVFRTIQDYDVDRMNKGKTHSPVEKKLFNAITPSIKALMIPQFSIGNYRADFAIPSKKIVIEVDGHDYHSSPEQKLHDSKRDRFMVSQGWRVLRFTGREVYHDVEAVVKEIEGIINP